MGAGANRILLAPAAKSLFPSALAVLGATSTFDQGDLVRYNATTNVLERLTAEAEATTFVGISQCSVIAGKLVGPYTGLTDVDGAVAIGDAPGPVHGVVAKLVLKSANVAVAGDPAYADPATGNFHVSAAGTKQIGVFQDALTGDGVKTVAVALGTRHPGDTLVGVSV